MAKIHGLPNVSLQLTIRLTESEARALDALVGYGDDAFLEVFYKRLGTSYMEGHEDGLRSLFQSVRQFMPGLLRRASNARKCFEEAAQAE